MLTFGASHLGRAIWLLGIVSNGASYPAVRSGVVVDDVVSVRAPFPVKIVMHDSRTYSCYNLEGKGVAIVVE